MDYNTISNRVKRIANSIRENESALIDALVRTETYKTAKSEIDKSLFCLDNIEMQIAHIQGSTLSELCVFLPMNQPLYSLVLFAIVPGFMFDRVFCRPPVLLNNTYAALFDLLSLINYGMNLSIVSRREFIKNNVVSASTIIYTGKYENAIEILESVSSRTIFIFQGSATNPIIIAPNAKITDELVGKVVDTQIYNSGQDCMAPAAIFVSKNNWDAFVKQLKVAVETLRIGEYFDHRTDIAPMLEQETIGNAVSLFERHRSSILLGGTIDITNAIVTPTIIQFDDVISLPSESSFAPIFSLYCYEDELSITKYLNRTQCQENKAYVSVFGDTSVLFGNEIVIKDDILDSVDDGYSEFGGFGKRSGFVSYNGITVSKPILISRELAMYRCVNGLPMPIGDLDVPTYETSCVLANIDMTGKSIIEVGCGTIPHAALLAPLCHSYVAIDTNAEKIAEAMSAKADSLTVANMNGANIGYSDAAFDTAFMFHCLHEARLDEQGAILREIHRVLKDSGRLFIIDAVSHPLSEFQQCFDLVHEQFMDYKHIFGVQHAEWIIMKYLERGYFTEVKGELHKMVFHFASIVDMSKCIMHSFMHEIKWTDSLKAKLQEALRNQYGDLPEGIDMEEIITFRILEKNTPERGNLN